MAKFSKNRKGSNENYKISQLSRLVNNDFAYSNKLAGRLYKILKPIQQMACSRSTYKEFLDALYKAVRNDQSHDLGSLRLGYGDVSDLKGFRFSAKTSLGKFFINTPVADFKEEKKSIEIRVPLGSLRKFACIHERLSKLQIKIYCIAIQINDQNDIATYASKDLELLNDHSRKERTVHFPLKDSEHAVILCLATVRSWLTVLDGAEQFLSNDTSLMTAEMFDVLLIRDGKKIVFPKEDSNDMLPPNSANDDSEIDWD
ncbi:MAG: hypothetical protein ACN6O7_01225 [Sphingobacterium sp.]